MDIFKREPELRRVIFGINAILRMPNPGDLPPLLQEKIGAIGLELSKLVVRVDTVRRKTVKDNEDHVAKGGFGNDDSSDENDDDEELPDEDQVFAETRAKLAKFTEK